MALVAAGLVNRLPYDIYLLIFLRLDELRDVLALKQVRTGSQARASMALTNGAFYIHVGQSCLTRLRLE